MIIPYPPDVEWQKHFESEAVGITSISNMSLDDSYNRVDATAYNTFRNNLQNIWESYRVKNHRSALDCFKETMKQFLNYCVFRGQTLQNPRQELSRVITFDSFYDRILTHKDDYGKVTKKKVLKTLKSQRFTRLSDMCRYEKEPDPAKYIRGVLPVLWVTPRKAIAELLSDVSIGDDKATVVRDYLGLSHRSKKAKLVLLHFTTELEVTLELRTPSAIEALDNDCFRTTKHDSSRLGWGITTNMDYQEDEEAGLWEALCPQIKLNEKNANNILVEYLGEVHTHSYKVDGGPFDEVAYANERREIALKEISKKTGSGST